jgi:putrescine transport system permease protein
MNENKAKLGDQAQEIEENKTTQLTAVSTEKSRKLRNFINACEEHIWRKVVLGMPYLWMLIFFLLPFLYVFQISLTESMDSRPPYSSMIDWAAGGTLSIKLVFDNYFLLFEDNLYVVSYLNAIKIAFWATASCLIIGYTMAYGIARAKPAKRNLLLLAVIMPFFTSFLLRVYAWMGLLANHGIINNFLLWLGLIDAPLQIMYTDVSMYIVFVYSYLPFMILPLYASLEKLDGTLNEAAADLGARPVTTFLTITLPLSIPGIIAGCMLTFIPAVGEFVVPTLVGGPDSLMIGRVLFNEFFGNVNWPLACAVATVLLALLVLPFMLYAHFNSRIEARSQ